MKSSNSVVKTSTMLESTDNFSKHRLRCRMLYLFLNLSSEPEHDVNAFLVSPNIWANKFAFFWIIGFDNGIPFSHGRLVSWFFYLAVSGILNQFTFGFDSI